MTIGRIGGFFHLDRHNEEDYELKHDVNHGRHVNLTALAGAALFSC